MSRRASFVVASAVAVLTACAGEGPVAVVAIGSAGDVLSEVRMGWVSAYNAADAERLASYFGSEAVLLPPGGPPVSGRAAVRSYIQTFFGGEAAVLEVLEGEVRFIGNLAVERAVYAARTGNGPEASARAGKYVMVWQKQVGDSWTIVWDMWNATEAPVEESG